jgi:ABC-type transport system substrate-binding protein
MTWYRFNTADDLATAYAKHQVDVARYGNNGAPAKTKPQVSPLAVTLFYGLNASSPELKDIRVRQAVVHAIDRPQITHDVYDPLYLHSNGVIPLGIGGYSANACARTCSYSPKTAKTLLQEVFGKHARPTITLDSDPDSHQDVVLSDLSKQLRAVGFHVRQSHHTLAQFDSALQSNKEQLFQLGRVAEFVSPDAVVWTLFDSGSPDDVVRLHDVGIDRTIHEARATSNATDRNALYAKAEHAALSQAVIVPLAQAQFYSGVTSHVHGYGVDPLGSFWGTSVWLN